MVSQDECCAILRCCATQSPLFQRTRETGQVFLRDLVIASVFSNAEGQAVSDVAKHLDEAPPVAAMPSAILTRGMTRRSEMYFSSLHPAQKLPLRPCNTLGVFSPLALGRNLEQTPNHHVSGAPEPMQVTGRKLLLKHDFVGCISYFTYLSAGSPSSLQMPRVISFCQQHAAGNEIETHEHAGEFKTDVSFW
jgi:hypothetical protein